MLNDHNNLKLNIISAICNMDVEGLKMYLPDDKIYFEMNKDTFIIKMNELFDDLKNRGNKCFNVHAGKCKSSICSNTGCTGFVFVSDFTKEHISIVLEYKDDVLVDWSECKDMSNSTIILDEEKSIKIYVWQEEKHDFEATDNFLQTITDVKQAKLLLADLSDKGLTKSSLLLWLHRYENVFLNSFYFKDYRFRDYKSFSAFAKLFYILVDLGTLVKNESLIVRVINEMQKASPEAHQILFKEHRDILRKLFCLDIYKNDGEIKLLSNYDEYFFDLQDFEQILNYSKISYDLIYLYATEDD